MTGLAIVSSITLLVGGLVTAVVTEAQQAAKIPRIGFLGTKLSPNHEAFLQGLRELGYVDGRTVVIEYREAEGTFERLRSLAAELAALKVDVIVAGNTPYALAAKQATRTIPIVFVSLDAVTTGLVSSLAQPGGNLTGVSVLLPELVGKCLELLMQAVPGVRRVAVLWQSGASPHAEKDMLARADGAARALGVRLQFVETRGPGDLDRAFSEMTKARVGALTVLPTNVALIRERGRLVDLAAKHRLPTVYPLTEYVVDAGGLMAYGPNIPDVYRRTAVYVDKILKGAKPGDLPVEQPTRFELLINLKAARALGLTIPPSLLAQADQVIEK